MLSTVCLAMPESPPWGTSSSLCVFVCASLDPRPQTPDWGLLTLRFVCMSGEMLLGRQCSTVQYIYWLSPAPLSACLLALLPVHLSSSALSSYSSTYCPPPQHTPCLLAPPAPVAAATPARLHGCCANPSWRSCTRLRRPWHHLPLLTGSVKEAAERLS